jgi:hypothetical protein
LDLPNDLEQKVKQRAAEAGEEVATFLVRLAESDTARPNLAAALEPLHKSFAKSSLSESEWLDLLEQERREMGNEKRYAGS